MSHLTQAYPAQAEGAVHGPRPATAMAPGIGPDLELGLALLLLDQGLLGHASLPASVASEGESEGVEQGPALVIGTAGGHDGDVHPPDGVHLVVVDLGKDELLGDAEAVVSPAVETIRVQTPEVPDAGNGQGDEPVEELPHPIAPQRHLDPYRVAFPQLEAG